MGIAAASFALRNKNAHVRYLLWLILLAKCLVPPLYAIPLRIVPRQLLAARLSVSRSTETPDVDSEIGTSNTAASKSPASEQIRSPVADAGLAESAKPDTVDRVIAAQSDPMRWIGIAWLVGAGVYLVLNLLRALRANWWLWKTREALPAKLQADIKNIFCAYGFRSFPRIWLMDDISQPFVWGLLRGSIYLPKNFLKLNEPGRQKSILGHELSHIVRFDAAVNILQVIAQAVFWFHPFVWWANKKIRQEREKCCDEMAIARLNTPPEDYSTAIVQALIAKYESTRPVPSLAVAGPAKNIEERIKTMMRPGKKFQKHPSLVAVTVVLLLALLTVPTALALTARAETKAAPQREKKPDTLGKLEYIDHLTREDFRGVTSVETSPDGRHAYAAAYGVGDLTVFKRNSKTGYIEHIQTISQDKNKDIYGAVAARVSPCGRYVVCTSIRTNTVHLFERDQSTGTLKVLDKAKQGENGVQGLDYAVDAAISPDSRFVYVIAGRSAAVNVFRITEDRKLAFVENNKGEGRCLDDARGIAVSPDGKYIYVTANQADALTVLERNAETGKTKLKQVIKDEQGNVHGLAGVWAVTCSPDGRFVYTNAGRREGKDNAICVFEKKLDGTLSLVQEIFDGQDGVTGFIGGNELIVSPDSKNLYALGSRSNSVVSFRRNVETGELTYIQTFYDSEVAGKDGSASGIGISPDGEYVYVAGEFDYSILIFKRLTGTKKGPAEALHSAACSGDIAQVKSLIASGSDVNKKTERGYTPLHWAAKANRKDAAKLLISAGANVNTRTGSGGWTPLHMAVSQGNKDMAEWFISKGADLNAENHNNGLTPLLVAEMKRKKDFVEFLISKGANLNTRDNELKTPLHCAARDGYADVVELLLKKGADANAKTNWGGTALHYASMYGHTSVAQLLIEKGADVRGETKYGWTPLLYAARAGSKDITELLLSKGADASAEDNSGRTALWWAERMGRTAIVELLRKHGATE